MQMVIKENSTDFLFIHIVLYNDDDTIMRTLPSLINNKYINLLSITLQVSNCIHICLKIK